uniref:Uncharacterized protein n=1 Tax=Microcebus murinus TaxID=30608 RepID=A0A8C6EH79_MICMU
MTSSCCGPASLPELRGSCCQPCCWRDPAAAASVLPDHRVPPSEPPARCTRPICEPCAEGCCRPIALLPTSCTAVVCRPAAGPQQLPACPGAVPLLPAPCCQPAPCRTTCRTSPCC